MAQGAKKQKSMEANVGLAEEMREELSKWQGPADNTVVRFEYTFDSEDARYDNGKKVKRRYYTYVALWIADMWYISGVNDSVTRRQSHQAFMTMLASEKVRRAEVAAVFEGFKP